MSIFQHYTFSVGAIPRPHGIVRMIASDKPVLEIATPIEFRDGLPGYWSPEDMLVGAIVSCYALTFRAEAHRLGVPFEDLDVNGNGHVTGRTDGRFGFALIELRVSVTVDAEREEAVRSVAQAAGRACIVGRAVAVPLELELDVRTRAPAPTVAQG